MLLTKRIELLLIGLLLGVASASAQSQEDKYAEWGPTNRDMQTGLILRAGYVIGGTSPMPLPAEIRSINEFSPKGGFTIGLDGYYMLSRHWGFQLGWHLFYEGFHTSADVKNYRMGITQGEDYLEGYFTGTDVTNTWMLGSTFPLTATYRISPRWNVSAGPFLTILYDHTFEGEVYDGYLRQGDPTGQKVEISRENRATYDFQDNMLNAYWGVQFLLDWKATHRLNVFGGVDWAFSGIFPKSFQTVEFKLYPIYAKIGLGYRL